MAALAQSATIGGELDERPARMRMVRAAMGERGLDALLVARPEDIYYLSGLNHQGYFALTALLLPPAGTPLLVIREMETPTVAAQVDGFEAVVYRDHEDPAMALAAAARGTVPANATFGIDRSSMWLPPSAWDALRAALPEVRWVDAGDVVASVRAVKSPAEVVHVRQAARISDRALEAGIAAAAPGVSEREVAGAIYGELIEGGSDYPGCAPFVRSGPTLPQEHVTWGRRRLAAGDTLFIEMSASVERYHAPITRLVFIGEPPPGIERSATPVLAGLEAVRGALRPGALGGEVYGAWQEVIDDALGVGCYRRHHCGYLVGIGFPPSWSGVGTPVGLRDGSELEVRAGMTFHLMSWILGQDVPDFGVSDTALVTSDDCELLTSTTRDPIVVT